MSTAPRRRVAALGCAALWALGCGASKPPAAAAPPDKVEAAPAPADKAEEPAPEGPLSQQAIERVIEARFARFQSCYDAGLKKQPSLRGQVKARIVIDNDGRVAASEDAGSSMPDAGVVTCVLAGFKKLRFPQPEGSYVTFVYPMEFDAEHGTTPQVLASGPFKGCSVAASQGDAGGTTTEIQCGSRKLVVVDIPAATGAKDAQSHLRRFEQTFSDAQRPKRSTPKMHGRSSWVTVVQERGKSWGTAVVVAFDREKTRVVECSGKPNGISKWCERHVSALAKGFAPQALFFSAE